MWGFLKKKEKGDFAPAVQSFNKESHKGKMFEKPKSKEGVRSSIKKEKG